MSPHPHVDTAAQRPATGLDVGARHLMMKVAEDVIAERRGSVPAPELMVGCLFKDRYGGMHDYMNAVESVWGGPARFLLARAVDEARVEAEFGVNSLVTLNTRALANTAGAATLLAQMPEPDFRLAVELLRARLGRAAGRLKGRGSGAPDGGSRL